MGALFYSSFARSLSSFRALRDAVAMAEVGFLYEAVRRRKLSSILRFDATKLVPRAELSLYMLSCEH